MQLRERHPSSTALILKTAQSLALALNNRSRLDKEKHSFFELCGFSGMSFRHFMNNMGDTLGLNYLEIGSYCGSTLISLLHSNLNKINHAYAIDDWSEFNDFGSHSRDTFYHNLNYYLGEVDKDKLTILEEDCFSLDKEKINHKINFYFYDGAHNEEDHYNAYIYYNDVLDDLFVTVVDDWNSGRVQAGTNRAFKDLNYNVLAYWEIDTSDKPDCSEFPDGDWWRGVMIAVVQKQKQ
tara:strand:- start:947 stop:1657 length:711 start_codon:yes stop_codon:yes gene_type:complete